MFCEKNVKTLPCKIKPLGLSRLHIARLQTIILFSYRSSFKVIILTLAGDCDKLLTSESVVPLSDLHLSRDICKQPRW